MRIIKTFISKDGSVKRLHLLDDGNTCESVVIPHKTKTNLCISSQVGCRMGCGFCATGKGFVRNLTTREILGQIDVTVDSVVFMGMGEPLDNPCLLEAIELIKREKNIPSRKIVVSTCGICDELGSLLPTKVNIAISLNAARDETRSGLMPINKKFPLAVLEEKMREIDTLLPRSRRLEVEYVMMSGVNDSLDDARRLSMLVPKRSLINLIPVNDIGLGFFAPAASVVGAFKAELRKQGFICLVRESKGADVSAACGMLATEEGKTMR
jgi:23S rRNA (adenine2503-C2)-methyltransferase